MSGEIVTAERRAELVAWLLGEAEAEVGASIEAELARGGALAAEKARLEGVLGLLAKHPEALAPVDGAASDELTAVARREAARSRGWRVVGRPLAAAALVTLAVGVTLFASGGFDGWLGTSAETRRDPLDGEQVAALDERRASLRGLGYVGGDAQEPELDERSLEALARIGYYGGASQRAAAGEQAAPVIVRGEVLYDPNAPTDPALAAQLRAKVAELGVPLQMPHSAPAAPSASEPAESSGLVRADGERALEHVKDVIRALEADGSSDPEELLRAYREADEATRQRMEQQLIAANQKLAEMPSTPAPQPSSGATPWDAGTGVPMLRAPLTGGPGSSGPMTGSGDPTPSAQDGSPLLGNWIFSVDDATATDPAKGDTITGSDNYFLGQGQRVQKRRVVQVDPDVVVVRCRLLTHETPAQYFLRSFGTRPFERTQARALSTFAASVDTASYVHAGAYLGRGQLPPEDLVRTEAFVNAFRAEYADAKPTEGTFALHLELAPSPYGDAARAPWLLRAAVVAKDVPKEERPPLALTFVVDVSGSMQPENRLPLVKRTLEQLVARLEPDDKVALVTFSNEARLVWPLTPVGTRHDVIGVIRGLETDGSTNFEGGVVLGYQHAAEHHDAAAANRVVVLSDGVGNVGSTKREEILARVAEQRAKGLYLNTIGVGMGDQNDALLDEMAQHGDGVASYIDDEAEARKALVDDLVGAFVPVARDVKLQLELDPAQVGRWRLLGYETRALADRSFRDDAVDAGEVNAGHTVVALWELEDVSFGAGERPLATLRVRHKAPFGSEGSEEVLEQARSVHGREAAGDKEAASPAFRLSAAVAQAAELLRGSFHRRGASVERVVADLERAGYALGAVEPARAKEPLALAQRLEAVKEALAERVGRTDPLAAAEEALRFAHYDLAVERTAPGTPDPARIEQLEGRVAALEAALRDVYVAQRER